MKKSTTSMVMGIIGLVLACTGFGGVVSIVLGILAMSFSKKAVAEEGANGQNKAGKITGLIGVIIGALGFLIAIICTVCTCALATSGLGSYISG